MNIKESKKENKEVLKSFRKETIKGSQSIKGGGPITPRGTEVTVKSGTG